MTVELTTFFSQVQQEVLNIASQKTNSTSTVIAVDMYTSFSDNLLADAVYYNTEGAIFIANRYYAKLVKVMK